MSTPNEDALKCAGDLEKIVSVFGTPSSRNAERDSAAHIRRLVTENTAQRELLRQAVEALNAIKFHGMDDGDDWLVLTAQKPAAAINEHLKEQP